MDQEDRRVAVNIKMSLASNLITVALAFIGAEGGLAIFILEKREQLFFFYLVSALAVLSLAAGVIFGGVGIQAAYKGGFEGQWKLSDHGTFHFQSLFCVIGAGLVLVSSVLGQPKREQQNLDVHIAPNAGIAELQAQVDQLSKDLVLIKQDVATLREARPRSRSQQTRQSNK